VTPFIQNLVCISGFNMSELGLSDLENDTFFGELPAFSRASRPLHMALLLNSDSVLSSVTIITLGGK
jgi:hypothetical protein